MTDTNSPEFTEGKLRERFANSLNGSVLCQVSQDHSFSPESLTYKWLHRGNTSLDPAEPGISRAARQYLAEGLLVADPITPVKGYTNARLIKLTQDVDWGIEEIGKKIVMFQLGKDGRPDAIIRNDPSFDAAINLIKRRLAAGTAAPAHWPIELANGTRLEPVLFDARSIELQRRQVEHFRRGHDCFHS